ncbi:MAG: S1C family serine protease [Desulfobacterales bacterium]|nr:S1C family serine protease [Desulfobacterales bacterium]
MQVRLVQWFMVVFISFPLLCRAGNPTSLESFAKVAGQVQPAVVTVLVYDYQGRLKQIGSGFFCSEAGEFLTNSHVMPPNTRAKIKTREGKTFHVGGVRHRDKGADIAMAKANVPGKVPFLSPARQLPRVGEKILVAGSPLGLEQTVSEGIVSAWRKIPGKGRVLQISAPISPGSSGGPVLNMKGEVVGVAAFQSVKGQNLNFAVPVDRVFKGKNSHFQTEPLNVHMDGDGIIVIQ